MPRWPRDDVGRAPPRSRGSTRSCPSARGRRCRTDEGRRRVHPAARLHHVREDAEHAVRAGRDGRRPLGQEVVDVHRPLGRPFDVVGAERVAEPAHRRCRSRSRSPRSSTCRGRRGRASAGARPGRSAAGRAPSCAARTCRRRRSSSGRRGYRCRAGRAACRHRRRRPACPRGCPSRRRRRPSPRRSRCRTRAPAAPATPRARPSRGSSPTTSRSARSNMPELEPSDDVGGELAGEAGGDPVAEHPDVTDRGEHLGAVPGDPAQPRRGGDRHPVARARVDLLGVAGLARARRPRPRRGSRRSGTPRSRGRRCRRAPCLRACSWWRPRGWPTRRPRPGRSPRRCTRRPAASSRPCRTPASPARPARRRGRTRAGRSPPGGRRRRTAPPARSRCPRRWREGARS